MKYVNPIPLVLLLTGFVVTGAPVLAKQGADDPPVQASGWGGADDPPGDDRGGGQKPEPGDDRGRGVGLEPGDDRGVHEIVLSRDDPARMTRSRKRLEDVPGDGSRVKGKLTRSVQKRGTEELFDFQVKFRYGDASLGMDTLGGAQNAAIFALFRDRTGVAVAECRFEFDEKDGKNLEYRVKQVRKGSALREKEGACDIDLTNGVADPGIPAPVGGLVEVYVATGNGNKTVATLRY